MKARILLGIILLLVTFGIVFAIKNYSGASSLESKECGKYSVLAEDNDDRIRFFSQFGIEVSPQPIEEVEIAIPTEFNKVYEKYNKIQKENGLDLEKHKGKTCTRYTYNVLNYNNKKEGVRANILVLNGKVIAGDICSVELGGFMHSFNKNTKNKFEKSEVTYKINKTSAVNARI